MTLTWPVVAAVLFGALPRVFFHAHLACFDVPVAALFVTTAYAYARSLESGRRSSAGCGSDPEHQAALA